MRKSEKSWNKALVKRDVLDLFKLIRCIFVFKSVTENVLPEEYYSVCAQRQNRTCLSTLPFSPGISRILPPPPPFLYFSRGTLVICMAQTYLHETRINILFQGCPVARSCMKHITSRNRHNTQIQTICDSTWQPAARAVDFCADSRRAGKLDLESVVEIEGDSGGAPAQKITNICVNLTTAGRKNCISCLEAM